VHEEHRVPNMNLLQKVFQSQNPRVRAAAIRTLGHWSGQIEDWENTLIVAARDDARLVRAEAVKAAVNFSGLTSAEVIFEVATQKTDAELETVLKFAKSQINIDAVVRDAIASKAKLSVAARTYMLANTAVADLLKLQPSEAVYRAILSRKMAKVSDLSNSLHGLANATKTDPLILLMQLISNAKERSDGNLSGLGKLLVRFPASELYRVRNQIEQLAVNGRSPEAIRLGYIAWIAATGPDDAFLAASQDKDRLRDFLDAIPSIDKEIRGQLYAKVEPLIFEMPPNLKAERDGAILHQQGIKVDYFYPSPNNVAKETLAKIEPKASGIVPVIELDIPQRKQKDQFALRFTGAIHIPKAGKYTFFTNSDDGSRLYIDKTLVVNNDGTHGMSKKKGSITLPRGSHPIVVTYFDNGGNDGLDVSWKGPGMKQQEIAAKSLSVGGGETLHDEAIHALASIPGNDSRKFKSLTSLIASGKHRPAAIKALLAISKDGWVRKDIPQLIDNLIGYLSEIPARYRTSGQAMDAVALAKSLAVSLPAQQKKLVDNRLQNLDVRVIAIGTIPQRMIFDKELIAVQAGKPVEFRFSNIDAMPHNFAITVPGSLAEVGELAEATGRDADAEARHYIPVSDRILLASRLLQPGESQALSFQVPTEAGAYPYVCTFPGHWRRMYGTLLVVTDLEQYQADAEAYLAANPIAIQDELLKLNTRQHPWKFDELISLVQHLPSGRSFEVGRELFKVASCIGCHKLNNEGQEFGPDLAKLDEKKHTTEHILRSILEPSNLIDEKYQSHIFQMDSGKIITGMILDESEDLVRVVIDPLAKDKATVIEKGEIEERETSKISIMPQGMLDKLSQEEILDLIAYVFARGDQSNALFEQHQHHHNH
ncbi:MAG: PA14 domain-containing protein, partial [Pirellulales bacterium]